MTIYKWIFPLKMAIFNSYVKLPEGKTRGSSRLSKWLDRQVSACQAHHGRSKAAAKDAGSDSKFQSQKTGTFLPMENHPKVVTRNWYELMKLRLLSCFFDSPIIFWRWWGGSSSARTPRQMVPTCGLCEAANHAAHANASVSSVQWVFAILLCSKTSKNTLW